MVLVQEGLARSCSDPRGGAEGQIVPSLLQTARAQRRARPVATARHDGYVPRKSQLRRSLLPNRANHVDGAEQLRHLAGVHARRFKNLRRPATLSEIQRVRRRRIRLVRHKPPGQLQEDVILRLKHLVGARIVFALVLLHPHQLRDAVAAADAMTDEVVAIIRAQTLLQLILLRLGARVGPDDGSAHRPSLPIHRQAGHHLPGEGDRAHAPPIHVPGEKLARRRDDGAPVIVRVLLRHAAGAIIHRVLVRVGVHQPSVRRKQGRLGAGRADVISNQIFSFHTTLFR